MKSDTIQIDDHRRGAQLSTTRITVLDIFYYLHRGDDFDTVHAIMPTLSRAEFGVVVDYVRTHHDELVEQDQWAEEFIQRGIAEQKTKGRCRDLDPCMPLSQRVDSLRQRLAEKDGARNPG